MKLCVQALRFFTLSALTLFYSACRIGNHTESAPPSEPYTGYYLTQPQALTLYITLNNETLKKSGNPSQIPTLISQYLTNPVLFVLLDEASGQAALADPQNTSKALPSHMTSSGGLDYAGTTTLKTHWADPLCKSGLEVKELGQLHLGPATTPPGFTRKVQGRLSLHVQVITQFKGDCAPTFQTLANCYLDASLCGDSDPKNNQTLQTAVLSMFEPWITAGVIQPSDIPHITNYAYEATYE